jgi:Zn-dependent M32 family carboxypeptidase
VAAHFTSPLPLPCQEWLNKHIHEQGSLYASGDELMAAVTGNALQPQTFLSYLRSKYGSLYKLGTAEQ